jgi:magnesium transporter
MPSESTPDPAAPVEPLGVAVEHATTRVPLARPEQAVGEVRDGLADSSFESADAIAVLAASALVGLVPIERLLAAPADVRIADVMDADPPVVGPGEDQEVVAWKMVRHGETLAVVDDEGGFRGIVPSRRMLDVLLSEHDEDLARLGGYLASTKRARRASEEPVGRRIWHRLPWLLIGLAGAMASVAIVGAFEEELDRKVLLAFFIPGVVYMADAVGTQTETLLIRGLSVGVTVRGVVGRELMTGAAMGIILGAAFLPFAALAFGDGRVAVAVALALLASCSIATVVAMALPWSFQRLGIDPAFGSGPLATVIQDLLSIAVYFAIAVPIAT